MPDLSSSEKVLLGVVALVAFAGLLYLVGFIPWVVARVFGFLRWLLDVGFWLWERALAGIPWPILLLLIIGVHVFLYYHSGPLMTLFLGLVLLLVGLICCLAYIAIDQERLDVARGYKVLYNPAKGQEVAGRYAQYSTRAGLPLLVAATLACVSGFALLNLGLMDSFGYEWYAPGHHRHYDRLTTEQLQEAYTRNPRPGYADFLVYSLLNLVSAFDLIDVLNFTNLSIISYVHPNRWPASVLLLLFRTFFTAVLLQQILSVFGKERLIQESVRDLWSPHEPIQLRAAQNLGHIGGRAIDPLLRSLEPIEYITPEHRELLLSILVTVGPGSIPLLVQRLEHPRVVVREIAMSGLGKLKSLETLTRLVRFRVDDDESLRLSLVEALDLLAEEGAGSIRKRWQLQRRRPRTSNRWWWRGSEETTEGDCDPVGLIVQTLQQLLYDPSQAVRLMAARVLIRFGAESRPAAEALALQTQDPEESVREQAVRTLTAIGGPAEVAVPALVALLNEEGVTRVRIAALESLASFGPAAAPAAAVLIPLVQDRDTDIRTAAARALKAIGPLDASVLPHLVEGLKDADNQVRIHAAEALGTIGPAASDAVPALIAAMRDDNARVRVEVTRALGRIGDGAISALPALAAALRDPDVEIAGEAAHSLGTIGPNASGAMASLLKSSHHTNPGVRARVAEALARIEAEPTAVLPRLAEMTRDRDAEVRGSALRGLIGKTTLGQPRRDAFLAALEDDAPAVRRIAVTELPALDLPREEMLERLLVAIDDVSDEPQRAAIEALANLDQVPDEVITRLARLLVEDGDAIRRLTLMALARLGPSAAQAVPTLFQIMQRADTELRKQVLYAATRIAPQKTLTLFLAGLHDNDLEVRQRASAGLILCSSIPEDQVNLLIEAIKDSDPQIRANVVQVCLNLNLVQPEMYPALVACTTEPDDGLRLNALRALRNAPDEMLEDVLPRLLTDTTPAIRLLAAIRLLGHQPDNAEAHRVVIDTLRAAGPGHRKHALESLQELDPATIQMFEPILAELEASEDDAGVRAKLDETRAANESSFREKQ